MGNESEEIEMLRRERDEAVARAEAAERAAEQRARFPARAVELGCPHELLGVLDPDWDDEEVKKWVESFRDYTATITARKLADYRPDRRRGNMLVQHSGVPHPEFALGPAAPDWLRERIGAMAQSARKRNGSA